MTYKGTLKKITTLFLILLMIFSSLGVLGNYSVYADENEEEETEERDFLSEFSSKDANIYNMEQGDSTEGKRAVLEKTLEYDPRVQYMVTYSFLADKFGVANAGSRYNGIYSGEEVGGIEFGVTTNPQKEVLKARQGDEDTSNHSVLSEEEKQQNNEKHAENIENLATILSSKYVTVMSGFLSPHDMGNYNKTEEDPKRLSGSLFSQHLGTYFNIPKKGSKTVLKYDAKGEKPKLGELNEIKKQEVVTGLGNENGKYEEVEDVYNYLLKGISVDNLTQEAVEYRKKKIGGGYKYAADDVFYGDIQAGKPIILKSTIKKMTPESMVVHLGYFPEYIRYATKSSKPEEGTKKAIDEIKTQLEKELKEDKEITKLIEEYLKTSKVVKQASEKDQGNVDKDTRILGWIPVFPKFDIDKISTTDFFGNGVGKEDLNEFFSKSEDKSTYTDEGLIIMSDDNRRPLRLTDLFYSQKSSIVLTMGTKKTGNDYASLTVGKDGPPSKGTSIGKYAGIESELEKGFWKKITGTQTSEAKQYNQGSDGSSYNVQIFRELARKTESYSTEMKVDTPGSLGVDTYGNIIEGSTGTILVPYWQNEVIGTLGVDKDSVWVSHAAYNDESTRNIIAELINDVDKIKENSIKEEQVKALFGSDIKYTKPALTNDATQISKMYEKTDGHDFISDLALAITVGTSEQVKKFNEKALGWGKDSQTLHITTGVAGYGVTSGDGVKSEDEYTNADLRARIMHLLDYGYWDTIKLTLSSMLVSIYNSTILNFSLSSVFHTTKITDTAMWDDIVKSLGFWLIGGMAVYISLMAIQVFKKTLTVGGFIRQFLIATLVILIPAAIYSPLIDLMINKPTPMIVGKQMQQMAILDYSQSLKTEQEEIDPAYALLFGGKLELRDREQDYIVEFYTTQHKNGYDITVPHAAEDRGIQDQIRSNKAEVTGKWNEKDVVKVNVSMFDLFNWAKERVDSLETEEDLFTWLANSENTVGAYTDIAQYKEYFYDPNKKIKGMGILGEGLEQNYETITASELFVKMYESSHPRETTGKNLEKRLADLSNIARAVKKNDGLEPVTMEEVEALIRDLSLSRAGRMTAFGLREMDSNVVKRLTVTANEEVPAISTKTEDMWKRVSNKVLQLPNSDYLNMESIIDELNPVTGEPGKTPNERHVYNINEKVLSDYVNIHHVVRDSLGGGDVNVNKSEFMIVKLNQFFRTNEELKLPMFPTAIQPETYSLDTYTRMAYIPIAEYKDSESTGVNNVGEYLALRDHPVTLIVFFLPAIFLIMAWGLLYFIVFGFLMVVLTTVSFVWNYIYKKDKDNRSWLGTIIVIFTFSVAKIGLLALWYGMFYAMNGMYDLRGGVTYPYMVIHSMIIIAYVVVCFKFIFLKVLGNLAKDPVNMGGEQLISNFSEALNAIRGKKAEEKASSRGGEGPKGKKSVDKALDNEGKEGTVKEAGIAAGIRTAVDKVKEKAVGSVTDLKDVALGKVKHVDSKYTDFSNGIGKTMNNSMVAGYEGIDAVNGATGISPEVLVAMAAGGVVGQILSSTVNGESLTVMEVGNKESATRVKNHLTSQGIMAEVNDDNDVVFNTTGRDFTDASVRKNVFGGLVDDLHTDLSDMTKISLGVDTERSPDNYTWNRDGVVTIPVGAAGLTEKGLDTLINSKDFTEAFFIEGTPQKDANGSYVPGSLDVVPRSGVNVSEAMARIYQQDAAHRDFIGDKERSRGHLNSSLNSENIAERTDVYDLLADGMSIQDGRILYDNYNTNHLHAVSEIRKQLKSEYKTEYKGMKKLMNKAMAYTTYGENNGFQTTQFNTSDSEEVEMRAREAGLLSGDVETVLNAGTGSENIVKNVEMFKTLQGLNVQERNNYMSGLDTLYRQGEDMFLRSGGENKYDVGLDRLAKAGIAAGGNEEAIKGVLNQYNQLGEDRNNANILPEEYQQGVEKLFNSLQVDLQEQGVYSTVVSTEINTGNNVEKEDKDALKDYVKLKREMKGKGIETDVLEQMGGNDFDRVSELVDDIEGVEELGEGIIKLRTSQGLDDADAARLVARLNMKFKD